MRISNSDLRRDYLLTDVAVIGMAGRFPGANNIETFWENISNGLETIKQFTKDELQAAGESETLLNDPQYVRAKGIIDDIEWFDAHFFGFSAQDARITDPQQRLFLECTWEALELAGYVPEKFNGLIGVYASMADSTYLLHNLKNQKLTRSLEWFQIRIATSLTTLSTQVSYRLNLKGPSINLTTTCSSALVAIATACRSLVDYDCDMAIAGASAIAVPQTRGYFFQEGGIESPDGHCRAFDINSKGTVFSNGAGVVILKRLQDAIEDGDYIYSIIKGWNINNDGADKVGFAAPSVNGQTQCMTAALALANIEAESISYIEAHGTGTTVGDPIELKAMTNAFNMTTNKKAFCAIGSVKTNIGHTDIASGMPSFIKVALALKNKIIPATLHYTKQNSEINFTDTPFYVNTQLQEWNFGHLPRRAGVNASGIGGTNAFLILEEYEKLPQNSPGRPYQLIVLSAKTQSSLQKAVQNLQQYLSTITLQEKLANVAFTLQVGRADFNYRQYFVCKDVKDALVILSEPLQDKVFSRHQQPHDSSKLTFMFSGQGSQYVGMAAGLYYSEPEFAKWIDVCCDHLDPVTQQAVQGFILGHDEQKTCLNNTAIVQPALFIVEYALANFFINLAIKPDAMIGHSLGEYVAACLAGVMNLQDALYIVCQRGHLMAQAAPGVMLAVLLDEQAVRKSIATSTASLAAVNSPTSCVISGEEQVITLLEKKYKDQGIITHRLNTSHAFHSHLMEPVLNDFHTVLQEIHFKKPTIPFISNLTGKWITDKEATNPDYWIRHLRSTVKFLQGVETVVSEGHTFFVEVGPGKTLTNFVRELSKENIPLYTQNSLPGTKDPIPAQVCFLQAVGWLWSYGLKIDWQKFYSHEKRNRIPLPTYSFDRQYYWVEPAEQIENLPSNEKKPYAKWFYEPSWIRTSFQCTDILPAQTFSTPHCWIIFLDSEGMGATIRDILTQHGQFVIIIKAAEKFVRLHDKNYEINITQKEDYLSLIKSVAQMTTLPWCVLNLLPLTAEHSAIAGLDILEVENTVARSFYSTLFLTQALTEEQYEHAVNILIVGNEMYSVLGNETIYPAKATATGPCRVIPQEQPLFKIKIVDLILTDLATAQDRSTICNQLIVDMLDLPHNSKENNVAYRNQLRWIQDFQPLVLQTNQEPRLKENGVYLFTGGVGGISLTLSKKIACTVKNPHLLFMHRSDFPPPTEWKNWLSSHPETDKISKKIHQLLEITKLGASINLYQVDVAHLSSLKTAIDEIKKQFPVVHGVIHAAGIAGGGLAQLKTLDMASNVLAPKVKGTYMLMHLLRHEPLDFFMLCSSISSILGSASQVDYCAANACLDAFSQLKLLKKETLCVSISWNSWREIGMAVETPSPEDVFLAAHYDSISPVEGATIFIDTLRNSYTHLIVSTIGLQAARSLNNENLQTRHYSRAVTDCDNRIRNADTYPPPQSNVEQAVAESWQEILGVDKVGVLDDFFALGGHSLSALKLLTKLENKFGIKLSLQVLQETRTIQKIAAAINAKLSKNPQRYSSILVPIRSNGKQQPLFLMHPVSGNVFCYLSLAKHLTFDCPIYGLQDLSLEQGKLIYSNLEEMAAHYIRAIKEIQPKGPYLLGGLSFGATLSVEIANQLIQQGEQIKPLLLFDGWAQFSPEQHIKKLFMQQMLSKNKACDKQFAKLSWARMQLLLNYQIPAIPVKLILFKAENLLSEYKRINNKYNHWDDYIDKNNIKLYIIPGDHETILVEPNVIALASRLDALLLTLIRDESFLSIKVNS